MIDLATIDWLDMLVWNKMIEAYQVNASDAVTLFVGPIKPAEFIHIDIILVEED